MTTLLKLNRKFEINTITYLMLTNLMKALSSRHNYTPSETIKTTMHFSPFFDSITSHFLESFKRQLLV